MMASDSNIILGISYGHGDSSAALVFDGKLVAAAEEERFTRIKHCALFPTHAIRYCLQHAKLLPERVDTLAIARNPKKAWMKKALLAFQCPQLFKAWKHQKQKNEKERQFQRDLEALGLQHVKRNFIEHHEAHLASVRHLAKGQGVALLSFDGLGDFVSTAIGRSTHDGLEILDRVYFPHSLGYFYTAMTMYLGFPHFGDEFKVMGLSSYGKPKYLDAMRELVRTKEPFGFELNLQAFPIQNHIGSFTIENGQPKTKPFYNSPFLTNIIGVPARKSNTPLNSTHEDLAKSVQVRFEEVANHLLNSLALRTDEPAVALAGGCAHNSVWVGQIPLQTPYKRIYVAPASSDAGISVGAAIATFGKEVQPQHAHWALLGPDPQEISDSKAEIPAWSKKKRIQDEKQLVSWLANELAKEKIIGLFRDRMEFGPRALGNRSILVDPRPKEMREKLNQRVKHRELFRPFAASVLWEEQFHWFENSFFSPSMEAVFTVKQGARSKIPAVVHVDNTCRIQSVKKETQPFFWNLIDQFYKLTGVPMLINTSFNDCEPIVCTEQNAIDCFSRSDMDHLVCGDLVISR